MIRRLLALLLALVVLVAAAALVVPLILVDPAPLPAEPIDPGVAGQDLTDVSIPATGLSGLRVHLRDSNATDPGSPSTVFVLLHGFTFNLFTWDAVAPALRKHGRVVAYDQVPYGLSDKPHPGDWQGAGPYRRDAALARLWALLDRLGVDRAILVGNSSGGSLALDAALDRPDRVEALVLVSPWVFSQRPSLPGWLTGLPTMQRIALALARTLGNDMPLLDRSYHRPETITDQRRLLAGIHRSVPGWDIAWAALLTQSVSDGLDIADHLPAITIPALVIAGAADRIVPVDDTRTAAAMLPNATYVELSDCGHVPQEECPAAVVDAIRDWLR